MHRDQRIIAMYAELSEMTGESYSPRLLMTCAKLLEELVHGSHEEPKFSLNEGGLTFEARGLDVVLEKRSWELADSGYWEDDDPTADYADAICMRSIYESIEVGAFL